MTRRAALYLRVSTDKQTVQNQELQLRQVAERRGWEVVEVYDDAGISGSKGRADRPGLDRMLNDANRRHFDVVLCWAIDRLGRSLIDLLGTIQHLEAVGVDLYIDQQAIDTTTPMGKLMFQVCGAFAEFERSMIKTRIHAGLTPYREAISAIVSSRASTSVRMARYSRSLSFFGRPPLRPRARADARPARVRSRMIERSSSASAAVIWKMNEPIGVVVSIACWSM